MTADIAGDLRRADLLTELGRYAEAREAAGRVLAADPGSAPALCRIALCLQLERRYDEMLVAARAAVAADPDNEWAHRLTAAAALRSAQVAEGLHAAREAVRLAPSSWAAHVTLARARFAAGQLGPALDAAERACALGPEEPAAHVQHASLLCDMGDLTGADAAYRQALAVAPDHADALQDLGYVRLRRGRVLQALRCFAAAGRHAWASELAAHNVKAGLRVLGWRLCLLAAFLPIPPTLVRSADPLSRAAIGTLTLTGFAAVVAWVVWVLPPALRRPMVRGTLARGSTWFALPLIALAVAQSYQASPFLLSEVQCPLVAALIVVMIVRIRLHGERELQVKAAVAGGAFTRDRFGRLTRNRTDDA